MSENIYDELLRCEESVRRKTDFIPRVALVLGSGLGDYASNMKVEATIDYKDIAGFPVSTAPGHNGRFIFGYVENTPVVCMQGRIHFYEGYDAQTVVMPIRLMGMLGAQKLILTNASGGISNDLKAGDLMLIKDQISFLVPSPLRGENIEELGTRFPDMSNVYDEDLKQLVRVCAAFHDIQLKEGVYIQTKGPQYETPAEINACRMLGADAVGMSTTVEAIAARHMGMKIIGLSCISNLAAGISPTPLSEKEVLEAGRAVADKFTTLVNAVIKEL